MKDIVRVENEYYVRATSALADDRTRVLKSGKTFAVFNRYGDIEALGPLQFGLFYAETRHLSHLTLRINERQPMLLSSTVREDNAFLFIDMTNVDTTTHGDIVLPRGTLHVFRRKFLDNSICYEEVRLQNYGLETISVSIGFHFDADFADIFEVRGSVREKRGERLPNRATEDEIAIAYRGLDGVERRTLLRFSPAPHVLNTDEARFDLRMGSKTEEILNVAVSCEQDSEHSPPTYRSDFGGLSKRLATSLLQECRITTSSSRFNTCLARSEADLSMLVEGNPETDYPYAGVPWFSTVFGRDGIVTALECLWLAPAIAKGVLTYLAKTQAQETIQEQDATPGKILHEMRRGEMAALKEVPFGRYYGSVDSTPLFLILAAAYYVRTADLDFINSIWLNIESALSWVDHYGDVDGDGFVEYEQKSKKGLLQQGWKDSHDSVFHKDGRLAEPPIALCEVQSYVYGAKKGVALLAEARGHFETRDRLNREADVLQARFEASFWSDELKLYVLALDGNKKPCQVRTSNAGHVLFTGLASREHAAIVAETLLDEQFFSGWGVRTVRAGEARYNPMSYHNGSVWPHDNALIGLGLALNGSQDKAVKILAGLYDACLHFDLHRLPELFCGFHKRPDGNGPTHYPVACAPQAWAAGSLYLLLRACMGLDIRAGDQKIALINPTLPASLDEVRINGLRVGNACVDFLLKRDRHSIAVEVLKKKGDLEIIKSI